MTTTTQIAKHLREVYFGGNWTCVNLRDTLAGLTWQQATKQVYSFNTIATLVCHMGYYVSVATKVLQGGPLVGKDELSFTHPPINSQEDWDQIVTGLWTDVEAFATLIEHLTDTTLTENFTNEKYGSYYRNLHGIIEHTHYHLGQVVLIKKILVGEKM